MPRKNYLWGFGLSFWAVFAFLCWTPLAFAATTHHYTCDDFTSGINPPSCSANVFTFAGDSGYRDSPAAVFDLTAGTWYLNFTYSGTGNFQVNGFATGNVDHTSSANDYVVTTDGSFTRIEIWDHTSFVGTISNVCVTDTPGDCAVAPEPPAGPSVGGSDIGSTTMTYIDNPNLDIALLFFAFFLTLGTVFGFIRSVTKK